MRVSVSRDDEHQVLFPEPAPPAVEGDLGPGAAFAVAGALVGFVVGALVSPVGARLMHALCVLAGAGAGWTLWREVLLARAWTPEEAAGEDETGPGEGGAPPGEAPPGEAASAAPTSGATTPVAPGEPAAPSGEPAAPPA
jgi:hypothetical protein